MAMVYLKDGRCLPSGMGFPNENEASHSNAKKWISSAIKHPGAETRAAHRAGESVQEYARAHVHSPGIAGKRARLAITLSKLRKS